LGGDIDRLLALVLSMPLCGCGNTSHTLCTFPAQHLPK
jgi:hypothetical protein